MNNHTTAVSNVFCKTIFQQHQGVCSKNEGMAEKKIKASFACLDGKAGKGKNSALGLEYGQEGSTKELGPYSVLNMN